MGREEIKRDLSLTYRQFTPTCKLHGIYAAILRAQKVILRTVYTETVVTREATLRRSKRGYQRKSITRALWRRIGQLPSVRTGIPSAIAFSRGYFYFTRNHIDDVVNNKSTSSRGFRVRAKPACTFTNYLTFRETY